MKGLLLLLILFPLLLAADNNYYLTKFNAYLDIKDYLNASSQIDQINTAPLNKEQTADLYNKIGFIYYNLKMPDRALSYYLRSLQLDNTKSYVYNNIGILYFDQEQYENAKKYYEIAFQIDHNNTKVLVNLAVVNIYLRNYQSSLFWFKRALNTDTAYLEKRFDKEKSISKLTALIKKYPQDEELKQVLKIVKDHKMEGSSPY